MGFLVRTSCCIDGRLVTSGAAHSWKPWSTTASWHAPPPGNTRGVSRPDPAGAGPTRGAGPAGAFRPRHRRIDEARPPGCGCAVAGESMANQNHHHRVVIEAVTPEVDAGRFPVKRVVGEAVVVEADVFADGHDRLVVLLRHRPTPADRSTAVAAWHEVPMTELVNDRWTARFTVEALGRHEYTVSAWVDRFASWQVELTKKFGAGQDVSSELIEGAMLVRPTASWISAPPARRVQGRAAVRSAGAGDRPGLIEQA